MHGSRRRIYTVLDFLGVGLLLWQIWRPGEIMVIEIPRDRCFMILAPMNVKAQIYKCQLILLSALTVYLSATVHGV